MNPPGGGGEATGLVTRFSHTSRPCQNASYPVELKLFSEIEIAKILCNTWFDDFDHERMDYSFTEQRIRAALSDFEGQETGQVQAGVSSDDVVALWDYLKSNYEKSTRLLDEHYWPRAVKLAPRLTPASGQNCSLCCGVGSRPSPTCTTCWRVCCSGWAMPKRFMHR